MTIFVWHSVRNLTTNYHDDGGLVVVAESLEAARDAMRKVAAEPRSWSWSKDGTGEPKPDCEAYARDPDVTGETTLPPCVWIFPNAGCC
jgi:hypothetical protein